MQNKMSRKEGKIIQLVIRLPAQAVSDLTCLHTSLLQTLKIWPGARPIYLTSYCNTTRTYKQQGLVGRAGGLLGPRVCFCCPLIAEEREAWRSDGRKSIRQKVGRLLSKSRPAPVCPMFLPASPQYKGGSSLGGTPSTQQTLCSHLSRD